MKTDDHLPNNSRRDFINNTVKAFGGVALLSAFPVSGEAAVQKKLTVGQIIDMLIKDIPGAPFGKDTVDTLKSGSLDQECTGIVSTSFATLDIINKAATLGANFIIVHEPTFYNHRDDTEWLSADPVYQYKRDLLKKHGIAVWRFHDYIHSAVPDGVQMGVLNVLGWEKFVAAGQLNTVTLPASMKLSQVIEHAKARLGIKMLRYIGDPSQPCQRIALLPGAAGGKSQISAIERIKPDVLIVGEIAEWETAEYIRDAESKGDKLSLIVLGHALSEEPGMSWLVPHLQPMVPGLKVTHLAAGNPLSFA